MAHVTIDHSPAAWVVKGTVIKISIFCVRVCGLEAIVIPTWFKANWSTAAACGYFPEKYLCFFEIRKRKDDVFIFCSSMLRFFKNEWPFCCLSLCLCLKLPWVACWSLPSHLLVPRWLAAVHPATSAAGAAVRPQAWKTASSLDGETWTHLCLHSVKPSKYLTLAYM